MSAASSESSTPSTTSGPTGGAGTLHGDLPVVAVIGGGQLARMMQEEAARLGIHLRALVEAPDGSTAQVTVDQAQDAVQRLKAKES